MYERDGWTLIWGRKGQLEREVYKSLNEARMASNKIVGWRMIIKGYIVKELQ